MAERTSAILELDASARDEVIDVLTESFFDYPVFRYILKDDGPAEYERKLRLLIGFYADARFMRGWPVYGVRVGPELIAAMIVSDPVFKPRPEELVREYEELRSVIGDEALERGEEFERASSRFAPEANTYFVGMLGVRPAFQRQGFGRWMMSHIEEISLHDRDSSGVTLTTEVEANVRYYEGLGYRVLGQSKVGGMTTWFFYKEH